MNQTEILALAEKHGAFVGINDDEDVNMCAGDVLFNESELTAFAAALMGPAALPAGWTIEKADRNGYRLTGPKGRYGTMSDVTYHPFNSDGDKQIVKFFEALAAQAERQEPAEPVALPANHQRITEIVLAHALKLKEEAL